MPEHIAARGDHDSSIYAARCTCARRNDLAEQDPDRDPYCMVHGDDRCKGCGAFLTHADDCPGEGGMASLEGWMIGDGVRVDAVGRTITVDPATSPCPSCKHPIAWHGRCRHRTAEGEQCRCSTDAAPGEQVAYTNANDPAPVQPAPSGVAR